MNDQMSRSMRASRTSRAGRWIAALPLLAPWAGAAHADEGGVSFWLPGQVGSFAAAPVAPGFSMPMVYYHASESAGGSKQFVVGGNVTAGLDADADLLFFAPMYAFKDPLAGGQASVALIWAAGRMKTDVDAVLSGPRGNSIETHLGDTVEGGSDLYPKFTLNWNDGSVNNWGVYAMGGIPTGAYQVGRLANIGLNHYSLDAGGQYTYLDPKKGHEFSATGGLTYNWENQDTDYKNGVDAHLDVAAAQFLSEQTFVGVGGYAYQQISDDTGSGAVLGGNRSRVFGAGPQVGYFFPMGASKALVLLRANWEFEAQNRADGWNLALTLSLPMTF
jgi:hypothetical protein